MPDDASRGDLPPPIVDPDDAATGSLSEFWLRTLDGAERMATTDLAAAERLLLAAVDSLPERPHPGDVGLALRLLGALAEVRGRLGRWSDQREVLELERRLVESSGRAAGGHTGAPVELRTATVEARQGRVDLAVDRLCDLLGDPDARRSALVRLAVLVAMHGAERATLDRLETALAGARAAEDRPIEAGLAAVLGLAHLARGNTEMADVYAARARTLGRLTEPPPVVVDLVEAQVSLATGEVHLALAGHRELAAATEAASVAAPHSEVADPDLRFVVVAGLADARFRGGDVIGARAAVDEALGHEGGDVGRRARLHELAAELDRREHRLDAAMAHLEESRRLESVSRRAARELVAVSPAPLPLPPERAPADEPPPDEPPPDLDRPVVVGAEELERRVASLSRLLDARTRQLERALIDLRDLSERTHRDPLTGLVDRHQLLEVLSSLAAGGRPHAVLIIDLDRFARLNEAVGPRRGDELLAELARRVRLAVGPDDVVARSGEDEFVVLLPGVTDVEAARLVAGTIGAAVSRPLPVGTEELVATASVGVAVAETRPDDPDRVLQRACLALGRAKATGRGRIEVFGAPLEAEARLRTETEALLHRAIEQDAFELHFQPVHPNSGSYPLAAEALLRLRDPTTGRMLSPGAFLPVAEEAGLAAPIGAWVLDAASAAASVWNRLGAPFRLAVNVSASQLDAGFADQVLETLIRWGLAPDQFVVELTEHVLLDADDHQVAELVDLRNAGVSVALDDFGTAYSSLSHLRRLPVDVVKVDRSFVAGMCRNAEDHAIVAAVVELSRTFGFRVIAEGVETIEQLDLQRRLGCHGAQGFLIGRPKPAAAFAELLTSRPLLDALSRTA